MVKPELNNIAVTPSLVTKTTPLPDGGSETKIEVRPSKSGAVKGSGAGAAVGSAIAGPAGAAAGAVIGGVAGYIFGPED